MTDQLTWIPVASLIPGHMIDLERVDDAWLDCSEPDCDECATRRVVAECEYAVVESAPFRETDECWRVQTTHGEFGWPGDLVMPTRGFDPDYA